MRLSLRYRIALIIFALEAVMMGVVLWQTLGHFEAATKDQLAASEDAMLDIVGGVSRVALLTEEYAELQPYFERLLKDPRVVQVLLIDVTGRVVAGTQASLIGKPPPPFDTQTKTQSGGEEIWRVHELSNAGGQLGILALAFSNDALHAAIAESRRLGISIAVVGMTLIAIVGLLVGILLTRRLKTLNENARRFTQGDLSITSGVHGSDEVGVLGETFDQMARTIAQSQKHLQLQVAERTTELEARNKELEAFSYSVSHDLRAPLRSIDGFSHALLEDYNNVLDEQGKDFLHRVRKNVQHMGTLIDDILGLSSATRTPLNRTQIDLGVLALNSLSRLTEAEGNTRQIDTDIAEGLTVNADPGLMGVAIDNLIENAWKYTRYTSPATIEFGSYAKDNEVVYFVKDNGAGFDMRYADKLFAPFQRLHSGNDYEGTGIGLATTQRIIHRHGGRIWAEAEENKGASFYFTLPNDEQRRTSAITLPHSADD